MQTGRAPAWSSEYHRLDDQGRGNEPGRKDATMVIREFVDEHNRKALEWLHQDYEHLGRQLRRRGVDVERLTARAMAFRVAVPSWGVGTGGTRFARFAGPGEPRNVFEKLDDCDVVNKIVRTTPGISLHIPWDEPESPAELRAYATARGLFVDSVNSNTFQDQPGQRLSYRFGSLTHTDPAVRAQAVEHNVHCLELGKRLGARSHTVWIGDGGNFPGQVHFRRALERYLESLRAIYAALPDGFRLFVEHKLYEPAFYSTVLNDWGTSYYCTRELGPRAFSLVDLGHHAPNVNIEMVVARLVQLGKLAGFHFNDSKYGDDDLDAGSIKPFQLFLVFNELVDAELEKVEGFDPAYMLDQSHNVTDPIESLMTSAVELVRAYVQAHLVDRAALAEAQERNDAVVALAALKQAFTTDVGPILAMARHRAGGAIDPVAAFRASGYRQKKAEERPAMAATGAGLV
jgi:L-rhamnose isomerase/sugar isomerase